MTKFIKTFIRRLLNKPIGLETIAYLRYRGNEKIMKGGDIIKEFPEEIKKEIKDNSKDGLKYPIELEIKKIPIY